MSRKGQKATHLLFTGSIQAFETAGAVTFRQNIFAGYFRASNSIRVRCPFQLRLHDPVLKDGAIENASLLPQDTD
jgi:hypothetical protein